MLGEPICVSTLSSHCSGPLRCSSIQQGVLVTVWRLGGQTVKGRLEGGGRGVGGGGIFLNNQQKQPLLTSPPFYSDKVTFSTLPRPLRRAFPFHSVRCLIYKRRRAQPRGIPTPPHPNVRSVLNVFTSHCRSSAFFLNDFNFPASLAASPSPISSPFLCLSYLFPMHCVRMMMTFCLSVQRPPQVHWSVTKQPMLKHRSGSFFFFFDWKAQSSTR